MTNGTANGTATRRTRVGLREYLGYWIGTVPVRLIAVAAVVLAWRPWAAVGTAGEAVPLVGAIAFAAWAAPSLDRRPSVAAGWSARLLRHRTTLLAAGVVVIAAFGDPAWWEAGCVVVLLVAYLVTSETWPWRWGRGTARVWAEALAACAGAGVVAAAAAVPVSGTGSGLGRVLAAGAVVALALLGGAVLLTRWRGDAPENRFPAPERATESPARHRESPLR
ncbi:hypothetical protein NC239_01365 [Streptomyces sp. G3]|uniref:hypothetical protein n=1 Tax=unclassified Streptomyces TaxID=2593676 RepID=UPI0013CA4B06|nr:MULTISPECIES: hypothetical protein [unclassified Streptomyces]MCM1936850.1 hypothetical protein [Streptomyces sp. G3]NDZ76365.1 hypothetical protein [Streptomyces sp. SID10362]